MEALRNRTEREFHDITSELYRKYTYADGGEVTILNPVAVSVSKSGHYVLDGQGKSHYVPLGWRQLTWEARAGEPHFVF